MLRDREAANAAIGRAQFDHGVDRVGPWRRVAEASLLHENERDVPVRGELADPVDHRPRDLRAQRVAVGERVEHQHPRRAIASELGPERLQRVAELRGVVERAQQARVDRSER